MKNSIVFFALLLVAFSTIAQEPSKPEHEKRVYLNDGNTYVQKSLPLYLKFSTEPNGKSYDLKSKATANYADPMYLDTEGVNYIRSKWAVDKETMKTASPQQEVLYELYADGLPPYTSSKFSGAPVYKSDKVYYGKGLQVDLTAKDAVSGVETIHYAIDGSYKDYSNTLTLDSEKEYTLYYYSNDNVGNAEATREKSFVVDLTSPTTNHAIDGIVYQSNILAPSTLFKLTSTDGLSGVRVTSYSFDDGGDRNYGNQISMSGLKDGNHTLYYYAIDNVKNTETKSSFEFYLDLIPPKTENEIVGDQYKGNYTYVSERTKINLSATDNKAGVKNIYYRIDGGERFTFDSNFNLPNKLGVHTVKYDANDNVENLSGNSYLTVFVDNKAPETGITYGNPQFFKEGELYINKDTKIKLSPRDAHSGVQATKYAIDGGSMTDYSEFTIPNEGPHTISFYATDNVNNEESKKESKCHVDNTPPVIFHNFSIEPTETKEKGGETLNVYPNYTRLYLGATDEKVGTEDIYYSIDGGALTLYSSPQTLDISELNRFGKKKLYEVRIVAKDKLGNESEKTVKFYIGRE